MDFDRLKLLEQKVEVLQQEINSVLGELQKVMVGLVNTNKLALKAIDARLADLESKGKPADRPEEGKEL